MVETHNMTVTLASNPFGITLSRLREHILLSIYDSYIDPLRTTIHAGADQDGIIDYLYERERETICLLDSVSSNCGGWHRNL